MAVWKAAVATLNTLQDLDVENMCFIGGLAAKLYGNDREPNVSVCRKRSVDQSADAWRFNRCMQDVDVLILDFWCEREKIKRTMAERYPCFYLEDPPIPIQNFKKLSYHPHGRGHPGAINIDILTPGDAKLPSFGRYRISFNNERQLPAAPLLLVLLHKVLGWKQRSNSPDYSRYKKHWQDASDVANLVQIASKMGLTIVNNPTLPESFTKMAAMWVREFIAKYPNAQIKDHWRDIGFY
jgi:hypothetical protein